MARQIRIEYEGAMYHLMARGYRWERIFVDDEDRYVFLKTIGEAYSICQEKTPDPHSLLQSSFRQPYPSSTFTRLRITCIGNPSRGERQQRPLGRYD